MSTAAGLTKAFIATQALSIGAQTFSGLAAQRAADVEASLQRQQAELMSIEANREAERLEKEAESFRKRQKVMFLKSGVALEGSPLLVLEETQRKAKEEADAIRERGLSKYRVGMKSAKLTYRKGRAALLGSTLDNISSTATFGIIGKEYGVF